METPAAGEAIETLAQETNAQKNQRNDFGDVQYPHATAR